jgi:hypothetical protein
MTNVTDLINDSGFIENCCRYAEKILSRDQIKRLYPDLSPTDWDALDTDEMVAAIDLETTRRIRSGASARERAALLHASKGIDLLDAVLSDDRNPARVRLEAGRDLAKAATPPAEIGRGLETERFIIRIDLSGNGTGGADVLTFDKPIAVGVDPAPEVLPDRSEWTEW